MNGMQPKKLPDSGPRPFVFLNVASSADGKLAPSHRRFIPFSSRRDQQMLYELRTRADAVMAGSRTIDSGPVTMGPGGPRLRRQRVLAGRREYNLRVVVSGSASLSPRAEIFRHTFSPIIVLVTECAPQASIRRLQKVGAIVQVCGGREINFPGALRWLRAEWGVKDLLCEGGGEINDALFRAGLVDELHLTLCPKIFGGRSSPTLADGTGSKLLNEATRLHLQKQRRVGDELFLVYSVARNLD